MLAWSSIIFRLVQSLRSQRYLPSSVPGLRSLSFFRTSVCFLVTPCFVPTIATLQTRGPSHSDVSREQIPAVKGRGQTQMVCRRQTALEAFALKSISPRESFQGIPSISLSVQSSSALKSRQPASYTLSCWNGRDLDTPNHKVIVPLDSLLHCSGK
jgi:hypothetical protein